MVEVASDGLVVPPLYFFDRDGWFYSMPDLRTAARWIEPLTLEESLAWFDSQARPVRVSYDKRAVSFDLDHVLPRENELRKLLLRFLKQRQSQLHRLGISDPEELTLAALVAIAESVE
jgi:hypothetical protein